MNATKKTSAASSVDPPSQEGMGKVKREEAERIIQHYGKLALLAGAMPWPVFDFLASTGVQVRMISKLARVYDRKFSEAGIRSVLISIVGSSIPQTITKAGIGSGIKAIPIFGTLVGWLTVPAITSATTLAVGYLFAKHFESGGTLVNINLPKMKKDTEALSQEYQDNAGAVVAGG